MTAKQLLLAFCLLTSCVVARAGEPFWLGADISGTTELEAFGVKLENAAGEPRENTELMKELGLNAVRLRVWVNPMRGFSSPDDVLTMALRAKALDMAVMIDFHYSDWWADPGKQNPPEAWSEMDLHQMCDALAEHTRSTLRLLRDNEVSVKWVQVGNETTDGFIWPMGQASKAMSRYAALTQAGYMAVKEIYPQATVIVHLDAGSDPKRYNFIFDGLKAHGVKWDMIGMSLYPYWDMKADITSSPQESIDRCVENIIALNKKYGCELMIVETGVEAAKPDEGYLIMRDIISAARHRTHGHCKGVFYWAPEAEGPYPLGAFQNHRPTKIMNAFTEAK